MTVAEEYAAKLGGVEPPSFLEIDTVVMPHFGITATVRAPRTIELARAGLLPLHLTNVDLEKMDESEKEVWLEKADLSIKRLTCECSIAPRVVDHEPRQANQIKYDNMKVDDIKALYEKIMDLARKMYFDAEPATEGSSQIKSLKLIAYHSKKWDLDPVVVGRRSPAEFAELIMYSDLLDIVVKETEEKAGENG